MQKYEMTHFWTTQSLKGGHLFLIKDDFFEYVYFDKDMHMFLGPVLQKVHFVPQVQHLREGFNVKCDFDFKQNIITLLHLTFNQIIRGKL